MMTREEEIAEQNEAIRAIASGLMALIDELHEAGSLDRDAVADRLSRARNGDGSPMPLVEQMASRIRLGQFASTIMRDHLGVIEGGKAD